MRWFDLAFLFFLGERLYIRQLIIIREVFLAVALIRLTTSVICIQLRVDKSRRSASGAHFPTWAIALRHEMIGRAVSTKANLSIPGSSVLRWNAESIKAAKLVKGVPSASSSNCMSWQQPHGGGQ